MPQLFQVLKCFKCSVFQVHQTKKSNKWECKLCGEKQSIKRHYGLGTAKECRFHVQKLNEIRGEINELGESVQLSKSSDDEPEVTMTEKTTFSNLINKSKWSNFIDETEVAVNKNIDESMYLSNTEVVLEVPVKKRKKFKPPQPTVEVSTMSLDYEPIEHVCSQNETSKLDFTTSTNNSFFKFNKQKLSTKSKTLTKENINTSTQFDIFNSNSIAKENKSEETKVELTNSIKTYVPPKVNKNSKWAEFAENPDENQYPDPVSIECSSQNILTSQENENSEKKSSQNNVSKHLFTLCDESELDDVLDF